MRARHFRRGAQPDDPRHVFRARTPVALVMPAVQERPQNRPLADVERAHAFGAVQFVRGKRQQIHAEFFHVHGDLADRLHRVGVKVDVALARDAADFLERLNRAEFVVGVHHADQHGLRPKRAGHVAGSTTPLAPTRT